jgi:thiamine biosynthesis lipoprotein
MNEETSNSPLSRRSLLSQAATLALSFSVLPALPLLAQAGKSAWNRDFVLEVNFEISQPSGERYRRPYVAVWIEDANGNPVRTLSLWVQTRKPGPRWIPDLKRWYRKEQQRKRRDDGDLIETISVATRPSGKYSLIWNGRNDDGKLVGQGDYVVCIEAAREHGTYQFMRESIKVGSSPFTKGLGSNVEIKGANVEYRKK